MDAKSRNWNEVKSQLDSLSTMLGIFKKGNDKVKEEILVIKNKMNETKNLSNHTLPTKST